MSPPLFIIRHTRQTPISLSYDELMCYNTECHTVVEVIVSLARPDDPDIIPYIFNPRILNKFVCLRILRIRNVKFLHPLFTIPRQVEQLSIINCSGIKSIITNNCLQIITCEKCPDLTSFGPVFGSKVSCIHIANCHNFRYLPRSYIDTTINVAIILAKTPHIDLSYLPYISALTIYGDIDSTIEKLPGVEHLSMAPSLFNRVYDKVLPKTLLFSNRHNHDNIHVPLSKEAQLSVINNIIKHSLSLHSFIGLPEDYLNTISMIYKIRNPLTIMNADMGRVELLVEFMMQLCPKHICPVSAIKFNPVFSLYESIIASALPDFYNCIVHCKKTNPALMAVFFDKMRDVMRNQ